MRSREHETVESSLEDQGDGGRDEERGEGEDGRGSRVGVDVRYKKQTINW